MTNQINTHRTSHIDNIALYMLRATPRPLLGGSCVCPVVSCGQGCHLAQKVFTHVLYAFNGVAQLKNLVLESILNSANV